jgi:DNA polymerase IV
VADEPAWILHVDLDQFLAAVEVRRRPQLRGQPVIVGGQGDPTQRRQVVQCASYEARAYGVHAGMALTMAVRKCPQAVFLASDSDAYDGASKEVMDALRGFGWPVEVWGWDEAFLGPRTNDPESLAGEIKETVAAKTGLSCAVGIGETRQRAKLAAHFAKPGGIYRLDASNWLPVMGERPTDALWGIGSRIARSLTELDLHTVAELIDADPEVLAARFGPVNGPRLIEIARGGTESELETGPREPKSRSRQHTYPEDLIERADIEDRLRVLADEVSGDVLKSDYTIIRVAVTVRTASFWTQTRSRSIPLGTRDPTEIREAALLVLDRFTITRPVRLLAVRLDLRT